MPNFQRRKLRSVSQLYSANNSRIVDLVLGALAQAIPDRVAAASQGTMNNLAMGARGKQGGWDYYETIAGGMGAGKQGGGLHAVQTHMTNTLKWVIHFTKHTPTL